MIPSWLSDFTPCFCSVGTAKTSKNSLIWSWVYSHFYFYNKWLKLFFWKQPHTRGLVKRKRERARDINCTPTTKVKSCSKIAFHGSGNLLELNWAQSEISLISSESIEETQVFIWDHLRKSVSLFARYMRDFRDLIRPNVRKCTCCMSPSIYVIVLMCYVLWLCI